MSYTVRSAAFAAAAVVIATTNLTLISVGRANSIDPAYTFSSAPVSPPDNQLSLGFTFTTNSSVTVNALGYFDYQGDGFATQHEVGIFDSTGTLLTSTLLSAGTVDQLGANDFRYQSITPVTLAAGQTYTVAGTSFGLFDQWVYGGPGTGLAGFAVNPAINIGPNAALFYYQNDNVLRDPTDHFLDYQIYAVNFSTESRANIDSLSAAPLPSTWGMMLAGLAGIGLIACRRARKQTISLAAIS